MLGNSKLEIMGNITHYVNTEKNLKTLKKGIHASDMDLLLSSAGPFTIFAPSDVAFDKLQKGFMEELMEPQNRQKLAQLVKNHVVKGSVKLKDLKDGDTLVTVGGKELTVQVKADNIIINDAVVQSANAQTINGIVHFVDTVLTTQ
jgi:uncharacterized surface protein with fasciclin (FAS1) repeats